MTLADGTRWIGPTRGRRCRRGRPRQLYFELRGVHSVATTVAAIPHSLFSNARTPIYSEKLYKIIMKEVSRESCNTAVFQRHGMHAHPFLC